jgi:predicted aconitase with swiveling domain
MRELKYAYRPLSEGAGEGEALLSTDALCFALSEADTGCVMEKDAVAGSVMLTKARAASDEGDA